MLVEGIIALEKSSWIGEIVDDCIQNEIRKNYNVVARQDDEENVALAEKGKK